VCQDFSVRPVRSGLARIAYDEAVALNLQPRQRAYSREVFIYADNKPVVFAHSTCALRHLRGHWSALAGLGNQPLGAMLFTHPLVERNALYFKVLRKSHPLYQSAAKSGDLPDVLWARRSLFVLNKAPLLVTEVFLPGILELGKS
jgi:chorismate--pyruvate lyase